MSPRHNGSQTRDEVPQGTSDYQLVYSWSSDGIRLQGFCDADYAGQLDTRKSTTGQCFSVTSPGGAVSWSSKLQQAVATSTTEAEVYASSESTKEAFHLRALLTDLGYQLDSPTEIQVDNQAAIALTVQDYQSPGKAKHYVVRLAYLKDSTNSETVKLTFIPTGENTADALTKGLGKTKTRFITARLLGDKPGFEHQPP